MIFIPLILLDLLLLWALIVHHSWWIPKLIAIVLVCTLNFLVFNAFQSGNGWSTTGFPKQAQFISCYVVEPDLLSGAGGVIYLWVIPSQQKPFVGYVSKQSEPRSFREPYSRPLHQACVNAQKQATQGIPVGVRKVKGSKRNGKQISRGHWNFYHLHPPALPAKKHQ